MDAGTVLLGGEPYPLARGEVAIVGWFESAALAHGGHTLAHELPALIRADLEAGRLVDALRSTTRRLTIDGIDLGPIIDSSLSPPAITVRLDACDAWWLGFADRLVKVEFVSVPAEAGIPLAQPH